MNRMLATGSMVLGCAAAAICVHQVLAASAPSKQSQATTSIASLLSEAASSVTTLRPVTQRFATDTHEVPDFRRHIEPLFGRLGCNGRACHGSFQGRGGFHLSLFGYDALADHHELLSSTDDKVDVKHPTESLILQKPTLTVDHEGGLRLNKDGWEYRMLLNWINGGAKLSNYDSVSQRASTSYAATSTGAKLLDVQRLEISPAEIMFHKKGETVQLRAIVHWTDGSTEDVTPLCRYQSNDETLAKVDANGLVTSCGKGDTQVVAFYDNGITPVPVFLPTSNLIGSRYPYTPTANRIDELVLKKLKKLGITQSPLSDDAEFLRRASLDVTGTLPTPNEIRSFLADHSPDKRARKIDELLARPAYAAWWATKLCDLTGNNSTVILWVDTASASEQWYQWMYDRMLRNEPYDKIVTELLLAKSHGPNESYDDYCRRMTKYYDPSKPADFGSCKALPFYWSRNNFRTSEERAMGFCYEFLGVQMQCCQCHKHPFDRWTKHDFDDFAKFFDRVGYGIAPADRKANVAMRAAIQADVEKLEADGDNQLDINIGAKTDVHADAKRRAELLGKKTPKLGNTADIGASKPLAHVVHSTLLVAKSTFDSRSGAPRKLTGVIAFDLQREIFIRHREGKLVPLTEVYVLPPTAMLRKAKLVAANSATKRTVAKSQSTSRKSAAANTASSKTDNASTNLAKAAKLKAALASSKASLKATRTKKAIAKSAAAASTAPSASMAKFLGGETVDLNQYDDPRQALVDWLHRDPTRYFARVIVNRVWAGYFNVGIVQPTDDLNQAHPPSNPELLDYLTSAFVEHGYDMKWLQREILNSRTYQLSWIPNATNSFDERNFSHAIPRRLPAEMAFDALRLATAGRDELRDAAKHPDGRAIGINNSGGTLAGRNRRSLDHYALTVFGKPARLVNSDCERSNQPSLLQTFYLQNDQETLGMIDREHGWLYETSVKYGRALNTSLQNFNLADPTKRQGKTLSSTDLDNLVQEAFLRTLSRMPRPAELARAHEAIVMAETPKAGLRDLLWALLNTKEFIINH